MHHNHPRRLVSAAVALGLVGPAALLAVTGAPASAAPAPYSGQAHGDIVDLRADLLAPLAPGSLASARIGHSESTATSTATGGGSTASSANLDAALAFGNVPIPVDTESVSAPPSSNPPGRVLARLPISPVADVDVISGDVVAAWAGNDACVPAYGVHRVLGESRTTLAGVTLAEGPDPIGALVDVTASQVQTGTYLVDDGSGGSDVLSRTSTTVGDIDLLGGRVTVDVTSPVVLEARSDGSTGTVGFADPPTIVARVGDAEVPVPLNDQPQRIALPDELEPLVDLTITAFDPVDASSGATGRGSLDALFRIDLEVLSLPAPAGVTVADVSLGVAPMAVEATAPSGGVDCGGPASGTGAGPDITSPAAGSTVTDSTPAITGTGRPGATVTVTEGGTVLCTAVVAQDGTWSCSPTTPLSSGAHTVTATQSGDPAGATDSTTFTVTPDPDDPDGDGLSNAAEAAASTSPSNPDTDGDGLTDGAEVDDHGTAPTVKDTDKDGLTDGQEVLGTTIRERFRICGKQARRSITVRTDPLRKDTDKDGLRDGREVKGVKVRQKVRTRTGTFTIGLTRTDPRRKDTDRDGLKDRLELTGGANKRFGRAASDPTKCDTDKGGVSDGREVRARSNPVDVRSGPRRPLRRTDSTDRLPSGMG